MDLSIITNETVKKAISELQQHNKSDFYKYFTNDAAFTDDGNILDLKKFFDNAFKQKEKFLDLEKVENNGKSIIGNFYAGQWGTFRVYFNFTLNSDNKISRLDIGQTSKL